MSKDNAEVKTASQAKSSEAQKTKPSKSGLLERFSALKSYFLLSRTELRKVSWPTLKETRTTGLVVLGFVTVMALLLGLVDFLLSGAIRMILS
jgi:preprotein translocase subunit SecE